MNKTSTAIYICIAIGILVLHTWLVSNNIVAPLKAKS